ncbi:MAG: tetratricopeptide repeat protein [Chloroflexi bacterium]|nr:tetratricopeptide repeat protein [Chloroflexota bacterium]
MTLARQLGDQPLLMRCYVNLPGLMEAAGGDWRESVRLCQEGLEIARRGMDRGSASWLASNLAELYEYLGRMRDGLAAAEEALDWARSIGNEQDTAGPVHRVASFHQLMGDADRAGQLHAEAQALERIAEVQAQAFHPVQAAWERWHSDPLGATRALDEGVPDAGPNADAGAYWLARMALRVSDRTALQHAISIAERSWKDIDAGRPALEREWLRALGDPDGGDRRVLRVAQALEALGYRYPAADAAADAALLAARGGRDPAEALALADSLYAECEIVPPLGPLPESSFLAPMHTEAGVQPA